jgi:hypothetical protein
MKSSLTHQFFHLKKDNNNNNNNNNNSNNKHQPIYWRMTISSNTGTAAY